MTIKIGKKGLQNIKEAIAKGGKNGGKNEGMMIAGDFGSGKSHLLEYLMHLALEQNFVSSKIVISKETPLFDPIKLYRAAAEAAIIPSKRGSAITEIATALNPKKQAYADLLASMGLSPLLVKEVFAIIKAINRDLGVTILLVEQNARAALSVASHGYIMEQGKVVLDGSASELRDNEDVKEFYLGGAGDQRRSFKNLKSFKRRKRWL